MTEKSQATRIDLRFGGSKSERGTVRIDGSKVPEPFVVEDVRVSFPITDEELEADWRGATYDVEDDDGKIVHTFRGVYAAAARKWKHEAETVRGAFRTRLEKGQIPSEDAVRDAFHRFRPGTGAEAAIMTEDEAAGMTKAQLLEAMRKSGMLRAAAEAK